MLMRGSWGRRASCLVFGRAIGLALALLVANGLTARSADTAEGNSPSEVRIAYLSQEIERPPALSNLQWLQQPADEGVQGARLGIDDSNTTGRFTGQKFILEEKIVGAEGDVAAAFVELATQGYRFVVANLQDHALDRIVAVPEARDTLIFNAGAPDDRFRNEDCRSFVLHTLPSRAMLADALGQYLVKRNWKDWFLVTGTQPEDALFANAVQRAAKRFGGEIVVEKPWVFTHDLRRTAQAEVPVFTQVDDYDVVIVADEVGLFGEYLMYRTWDPRPVVGTQGLVPTAWDRTVEQWGAAQLQNRFVAKAGRWMTAKDYATWAAVRSIAEAATRTKSTDFDAIASYIRSDAFQLAGFKGRKLSYRAWNGQFRQPIPLTAARALVAQAPMEGFLHQHTDLDTLGYDQAGTACDLD